MIETITSSLRPVTAVQYFIGVGQEQDEGYERKEHGNGSIVFFPERENLGHED
jgi:hypothetical protein